jgi:hypothetical protein
MYTEQEYKELKDFVSGLKDWLPEDKMSYVWDNYLKINGHQEPKPCGCKTAAGLWAKAVNRIKEYINEQENLKVDGSIG